MSIKGVIFDVDGTLLDTETYLVDGWRKAAVKQGFEGVPDECLKRTRAISKELAKQIFKEYLGESFDYEQGFEDHTAFAEIENKRLGKGLLKPGFFECIDYLRKEGIPYVLATSTPHKKTEEHLKIAEVEKLFDLIVTREDVVKGKPEPDIFIKAAERIGVPVEECLVVEDSYNGIEAAYRGRFKAVMIPDFMPAREEDKEKATVLNSLAEIVTYIENSKE